MDRQFNTPSEIIEANIGSGVTKANMNIVKMIILGMLAGAFIAVGGTASNVAVHNISNVGVARALAESNTSCRSYDGCNNRFRAFYRQLSYGYGVF